jgi:hypothetical protein
VITRAISEWQTKLGRLVDVDMLRSELYSRSIRRIQLALLLFSASIPIHSARTSALTAGVCRYVHKLSPYMERTEFSTAILKYGRDVCIQLLQPRLYSYFAGYCHLDEEDDTFLRNVGSNKTYTASHSRRRHSS